MKDKGIFDKINDNNLRAFVIHGAIILLWVVMLLPFDAFGILPSDLLMYPYILIAVPLLYVVLGYRFLTPLSSKGLLSVSYLSILFVVLSIILSVGVLVGGMGNFLGDEFGTFTFAVVAPNIPSIYALVITFELISGPEPVHHLIPLSISYIAAFVPTLLMFAGMRLKLWRQTKQAAILSAAGIVEDEKGDVKRPSRIRGESEMQPNTKDSPGL